MKENITLNTPKDFFGGLAENWRSDMLAGMVVSLIALPMCLSISQASGFPAIAGIYTAIIGGILVTFFAGSYISIKGPAGGLSAIALGAVETLGSGDIFLGYKYALATIVVSGIIQIIFGLIRAGNLGDFFPSSVIHGMLAALGLMMAIKQVPILLGVSNIKGKTTIDTLVQMPEIISKANPEIAFIGFLSLAIMILMAVIKNKYVQMVPGQLVVLVVIIPLTLFFSLNVEHSYIFGRSFSIDPRQALVDLPDNFLSGIIQPDFSTVFTRHSINFIILFALVGSIESVLSDKATDNIDPFKRKTDNSRDLIAIGVGNVISGFIGGLPMISESKRSVININNGAKTRWSNFFHGVFLVGLVLVAVPLVELIPHAALSAMLIFTGYRMAAPKEFIKTLKIGREQLIVFNVTILASIFFDILIG
ncbi:MAG: SulP family inorganic anion transporter, partial [Cytophagales bacterium]|nr:SulP family inorganic anion transporter [Cytophagales bacterium]